MELLRVKTDDSMWIGNALVAISFSVSAKLGEIFQKTTADQFSAGI
jgi:hypothetical protein